MFHQSTKTHSEVTKLPPNHSKRMLNFGPRLSFAIPDLAIGLVEHTAFIRLE